MCFSFDFRWAETRRIGQAFACCRAGELNVHGGRGVVGYHVHRRIPNFEPPEKRILHSRKIRSFYKKYWPRIMVGEIFISYWTLISRWGFPWLLAVWTCLQNDSGRGWHRPCPSMPGLGERLNTISMCNTQEEGGAYKYRHVEKGWNDEEIRNDPALATTSWFRIRESKQQFQAGISHCFSLQMKCLSAWSRWSVFSVQMDDVIWIKGEWTTCNVLYSIA